MTPPSAAHTPGSKEPRLGQIGISPPRQRPRSPVRPEGWRPRQGSLIYYSSAVRILPRGSECLTQRSRRRRRILPGMRVVWLGAAALVIACATCASSVATPSSVVEAVPCSQAINGSVTSSHTPEMRLVLGRVWLPKSSLLLRWPAHPNLSGNARFLKWGLVVTAGPTVQLDVPPSMRSVYALYFNSSATSVAAGEADVYVTPCPKTQNPWTVWAGGYLVNHPACVPLIVHVGTRSERVSLALGRRC
jgi:hypothetical protein